MAASTRNRVVLVIMAPLDIPYAHTKRRRSRTVDMPRAARVPSRMPPPIVKNATQPMPSSFQSPAQSPAIVTRTIPLPERRATRVPSEFS